MQARYYDPVIGRFYSNDPVGALGHMSRGNPVHGFGRYTYANNNPYRYTDPDGQYPCSKTGGCVASTNKHNTTNTDVGSISKANRPSKTNTAKMVAGAVTMATGQVPAGAAMFAEGFFDVSLVEEGLTTAGVDGDTAENISAAVDIISGVKAIPDALKSTAGKFSLDTQSEFQQEVGKAVVDVTEAALSGEEGAVTLKENLNEEN